MIRLGQSADGRLVLGSNEAFPADIKYVEYYREQKLFNLVYDTPDEENDLMPLEISEEVSKIVETSPNLMVIAMAGEPESGEKPYGYTVSLVQVGF